MTKKIQLLIALLFLFISKNAVARWANIEDAVLVYDFYNIDYKVNKDGTYEIHHEFKAKIAKESARDIAARYAISYNASSSNVEIIKALTVFDGKEYAVTPDMIEDKAISGDRSGFDDINEYAISFPKPELGSNIYLNYIEKTNKVPTPYHFSDIINLSNIYHSSCVNAGYININSEIPLKVELNDPTNSLEFKEFKKDKSKKEIYRANIDFISPIQAYTINESASSALNPANKTWVAFSSFESQQELGNIFSVDYAKKLNQDLPPIFQEIVKVAENKKGFVDIANSIMSELNQKVQYLGDWRSVAGKFHPKDLAETAISQKGDCKDYATITTKILRALGYEAHVALVYRGRLGLETKIPTMNMNHAIVYAKDGKGQEYWLDPTNYTSMSDNIFPDIADRLALVLKAENATKINIPPTDKHSSITNYSGEFEDSGKVQFEFKLSGINAQMLTGAELFVSQETIENWIYNNFLQFKVDDKYREKSEIPSLKSRIIKPINFKVSFEDPKIFIKTNYGKAIKLNMPDSAVSDLLTSVNVQQSENDLYLHHPSQLKYRMILKDKKIKNISEIEFSFASPFITIVRKNIEDKKDTIIDTEIVIHKAWITNKEIHSDNFANLQKVLLQNETFVILE